MSTNNSLISAVGFLILATGSGAAYTGYNYLQGVAQDTFMLKHAYSLQNSIAQAVYLTERAASDSTYVPELEALEAAAEKAISDLRAGDPVRGIPPAPPAVQANVSALQSVWSEVAQSLAQIISRRGVTDQYSRNLADAGRAADLFVIGGDRAGTGDDAMAALDDEVGIGADQRRLAGREGDQHVVIVFRHLRFVVEEAGADDRLGLFGGHANDVEVVQQVEVAVGAEEEDLLRPGGDQRAGDVARGDNLIIGRVGNADHPQLVDDVLRTARRIGDENH